MTKFYTQKETVQAYLDLHKNEFFPRPSDNTIMANMIGGVYGECRCENESTGLYEIASGVQMPVSAWEHLKNGGAVTVSGRRYSDLKKQGENND